MKKGRLALGLGIVLVILSFLPTNWFLPRWFEISGYYDLSPGAISGPTLVVFYKSVVELDIGVTGANRDVFFYITNSNGDVVFDTGRIYDGYHLEWEAPSMGSYRLHFSNTMSWVSHKGVSWRCEIFHYNGLFLLLGICLLIVGVVQICREEKVIPRIKGYLFKKPEPTELECEYCGTIYSKTLPACPSCGATRKARAARKRAPKNA